MREACWSASQPTIAHAVVIISTEPASNKQLLQPENIQQAPLKSFLHLNHLFEEGPFENGLNKLYVLKKCPYQFTYVDNITECDEQEQKIYVEQIQKVMYDLCKQLDALGICNTSYELIIQNTSKDPHKMKF